MPRYQTALGCDLLETATVERVFRRKKQEVTPATIDDVSINGAHMLIPHPSRTDRFRVGDQLKFAIGEARGTAQIRHAHPNGNGIGLGVQFKALSPELERMVYDVIDAGHPSVASATWQAAE